MTVLVSPSHTHCPAPAHFLPLPTSPSIWPLWIAAIRLRILVLPVGLVNWTPCRRLQSNIGVPYSPAPSLARPQVSRVNVRHPKATTPPSSHHLRLSAGSSNRLPPSLRPMHLLPTAAGSWVLLLPLLSPSSCSPPVPSPSLSSPLSPVECASVFYWDSDHTGTFSDLHLK